jgi:hypothetical protein
MSEPISKGSRLCRNPVHLVGQSGMRDDRPGMGPMAGGLAVQSRKRGTSETSVDYYFTRQCIAEDTSELRTRSRENFKSQLCRDFVILNRLR